MPEILKKGVEVSLGAGSVVPMGENPVLSVNGKRGEVELDASDVGALPDDTKIPEKLSDLRNDGVSETVKTYADLLTSTADRVHVLDISDGKFGLRGDCWFEKTDLPLGGASSAYAVRTSDNAVMLASPNQAPIPAANAPQIALADCIGSYFRNSALEYGMDNGLFNDACVADAHGKYHMDCSMFANAVLDGITFENSRYTLGSAAENVYGTYMGDNYLNADTRKINRRTHALTSAQQAEWFAQQKRLFRFPLETGDYRDSLHLLRYGDVLFSETSDHEPSAAYGIGHVQIVLAAYDPGVVLVAEVGGSRNNLDTLPSLRPEVNAKLTLIDFKRQFELDNMIYRVFARPNYGGAPETAVPVEIASFLPQNNGDPIASKSVSERTVTRLAIVNLSEKMEPGKAYTLLLRGKFPAGEKVWYQRGKNDPLRERGASLLITNGLTNENSYNLMCTFGIRFDTDTVALPFVYPSGAVSSPQIMVNVVETPLETVPMPDGTTQQVGTTANAQEYQITAAAVMRGVAGQAALAEAQGGAG